MTRRRLAPIALLLAGSTGCAAGRMGQLSRPEPIAAAPLASPAVATIVAGHNRNAAMVTTLQAAPSVSAKMSRLGGGARGHMVFERPTNFRFVVESGISGRHEADIGSNDEEFWFWANDKKDRNIYVSRYDSATAAPSGPELAFQPEWIVEALGLRNIPEAEASQIRITAGPRPGTVTWTHRRATLRGQSVKKETIVDRSTGAVVEHRFYAPDQAAPVAVANPMGTKGVPLADDSGRTVAIPQKIHLKLAAADPRQAAVEMDLVLNDLKVNAPISQARRDELFAVPSYDGSQVVRLDGPADRDPEAEVGRASIEEPRPGQIRRSVPPPETGEGATLGEPAPLDADGAYLKRTDPMPLGPDLGEAQAGADEVVGTPIPRALENPAERMARREAAGPGQ